MSHWTYISEEHAVWQLIDQLPPSTTQPRQWRVATVIYPVHIAIALAFRWPDGRWTLDPYGRFPLWFEPEQFADLPMFPPWPPPHLLPTTHSMYRPLDRGGRL